jgi:hypothetical protein
MDWLIFKLAEDASGRGELDESVSVYLDAPFDRPEKAAKTALAGAAGVTISASEAGIRLSGSPTIAHVQKVAEAVEKVLGPVGICEIKNNEWWDRDDFKRTRAPLG